MSRSLLLFVRMTLFSLLLLAGLGQANATLLYDNGPINGNTTAYTINFGYLVSNSFTLNSASSLSGAQIGLWMFPGDLPGTVDWSIGTSAFGTDITSGAGAGLADTFQYNNAFGYDIYESNFALNGALGAGTYWLTLQNATTPSGSPMYWDQNSGPSQAFDSALGAVPSESFQIFGTTVSPVPEPASFVLLGAGLLGMIGYGWRRRHSTASV